MVVYYIQIFIERTDCKMNRIEDIVSAVKLEELKNIAKVSELLHKRRRRKEKMYLQMGHCSDWRSYSRSGSFCSV